MNDLIIIINSENLEKRSKLRSFFEKSKKEICVAFYPDNEQTLIKIASNFFKKLDSKNEFIEMTTDQLFDKTSNKFLADRFVIGTCPICSNKDSYGDQCEKCGTSHNPRDLINPRSSITGNKPSLRTTKHWYLKLDKFQGFLEKWILEDNKGVWKSNVYGQCKSWLDDGLKPRAVTRDLDWGIPVPVKNSKGKVLYVWFDAPIGYISSTKKWAIDNKQNWEKYWKDNNTELIHFIGTVSYSHLTLTTKA